MKILKLYKTYKNWKLWKKIVLHNKGELTKRGFLINWIYELGVIISLNESEISDLEEIFKYNNIPKGLFDNSPESKFAYKKIGEFFEKQNDFFLQSGLLELMDKDEFDIEKSPIAEYTYYIKISFKKEYHNKFMSFLIFIFFISLFVLIFLEKINIINLIK
jgi:hypothetical protein